MVGGNYPNQLQKHATIAVPFHFIFDRKGIGGLRQELSPSGSSLPRHALHQTRTLVGGVFLLDSLDVLLRLVNKLGTKPAPRGGRLASSLLRKGARSDPCGRLASSLAHYKKNRPDVARLQPGRPDPARIRPGPDGVRSVPVRGPECARYLSGKLKPHRIQPGRGGAGRAAGRAGGRARGGVGRGRGGRGPLSWAVDLAL
jgi:hypothetical protein